MPTYDYKCPACFAEFEAFVPIAERNTQHCACGNAATLQFGKVRKPIIFYEGWYPHLDTKPLYFTEKKQLIDACKARNLTSPYVM